MVRIGRRGEGRMGEEYVLYNKGMGMSREMVKNIIKELTCLNKCDIKEI